MEDNFSDKNFFTNPTWQGDTGKFAVSNTEKLQLAAPEEASSAYLSTVSQAIADASWQCLIEISANPSSTNYAKLYLTASHPALNESLNGYFVKIGGTTDEVSLYRQDGTQEIKLIDGADGRVNTSTVSILVNVTRDINGHWALSTQKTGEATWTLEGTVHDFMHTVADYTGIYCQYTATRSTAFAFDDFVVTGVPQPDYAAPSIKTASFLANDQVLLTFSEAVTPESAAQAAHYQLDPPAAVTTTQVADDSLILSFSPVLENADSLKLRVHSLADAAGNIMTDTTLCLFYFQEVAPQFRDIVINEWLPDPNPQQDSLPADTNAEFVEIYNRSAHPFGLKGWHLNGHALPEVIILPDTYLILCRPEYVTAYRQYGHTMAMSSWPALGNTGSSLYLTGPTGQSVDSLSYRSDQVVGGFSVEQVNPDETCNFSGNYQVSTHSNGATPGSRNATFDNTPDTSGPLLTEARAVAADTLLLYFDEPVYTEAPDVRFTPSVPLQTWQYDTQSSVLRLILGQPLASEVSYAVSLVNFYDCQGNTRAGQTAQFYVDTTPPRIEQWQWLDTATIALHFHEKLDEASATKLDNFVLLSDATSPKKVVLGSDSMGVMLTFTQRLSHAQTYELRLTGMADRQGNQLAQVIYPFQTVQAVDTVKVVNAHQVDVVFRYSLADTTVRHLHHYLLNDAVTPQAAVRHPSDTRLIHLMFGTPLAANKAHVLAISHLTDVTGQQLQTPRHYFDYDTQPPKVASVEPTGATTLRIVFNEIIQDDLSALALAVQSLRITSVGLTTDRRALLVALSDSLHQRVSYSVSLSGLADMYGNRQTEEQRLSFRYDTEPPRPIAWRWHSPVLLQLTFDEALHDTTATVLQNYQIAPATHPQAAVQPRADPATVLLEFDVDLPDVLRLSVQGVSDLQGNIRQDTELLTVDNRELDIGSAWPASDRQVRVTFTKNDESFHQLKPEQFILNDSLPAQTLFLLPGDAAVVVLSFSEPLRASNTITVSADGQVIRHPLKTQFAYSHRVTNLAQVAPSGISITFGVPVALPADASHYFIVEGKGHPTAVIQTDPFTFQLLFAEDFRSQEKYMLDILSFADAEYGLVPASTHHFGTGTPPQRYQLLITEIMADPTPVAGLPEAEYVELYNPTDRIIDLTGLTLSDGQDAAAFVPSVLMPHTYALVCSKSEITRLAGLSSHIIGLSNFPSLNNDQDVLMLHDAEGSLVFSVAYDHHWYNDAQKKNGGWSLEMIDTRRPCGEAENWTASVHPAGGTPGAVNAVQASNPDNQSPVVQHAWVTGDSTLLITFHEKIDPVSLQPGAFLPGEGLQPLGLQVVSEKEVLLTLDRDIPPGKTISLQVQTVTDCAGNAVDREQLVTFAKPESAAPGDVVLSELLFNPRAGGVAFVELYNHSDKFIDLQHWQLANIKEDTLADTYPIAERPLLLAPNQYMAFSTNSQTLKADYPAAPAEHLYTLPKLPTLYVSEGTIRLLDTERRPMDHFQYSERLHHPLVKDPKGISLEKISWDTTASVASRWQSAASAAGFATPGYRNSQLLLPGTPDLLLSVEPKIFSPYQGLQPYATIHYRMQEAGSVATLSVFNVQGKRVNVLLNQQTLAREGWVNWDGTDQQQRPLPIGHYIILMQVYDLQGKASTYKTKVVIASPF